jgi:carbonic anhydrase/SulP family sulfate permease
VLRVVESIRKQSETLDRLVRKQQIAIIGAMYDVGTGALEFLTAET